LAFGYHKGSINVAGAAPIALQ